ncbi:hypothetical protein AMATHDRAFT_68664 [Amanita thiersii Skay4041]|uniref:Uncharacterized protein n=1 Tax=Amanita thiersii Skay4041 TaxID=703135 RepID=A0A2A9NFC0_9AGAR|nr:hypothetical protein AMATHDRAFT_68664 [Amanita thiersii Skay4041]
MYRVYSTSNVVDRAVDCECSIGSVLGYPLHSLMGFIQPESLSRNFTAADLTWQ